MIKLPIRFALISWILTLPCSAIAAADTPAFGIYAYDATAWNKEAAEQFPIVFVQYHSWNRDIEKIQQIRDLAAKGSRVIVDFEFLKTRAQRTGREAMPSFDSIIADADYFMQALGNVPLEGITLDEENSTSSKHLESLGKLYELLKNAYPNQHFLQWVSVPTDTALKRIDLSTVPADGWVMNPYLLSVSRYSSYVREMRSFSNRLYSVIWAAPNWKVGGGFRQVVNKKWWNDQQWKVFYNRLSVNQENDIPSIFYLYALKSKRPIMTWKGNACALAFYAKLSSSLIPYMRQHKLPLKIPDTKPNWMPTYC